MVHALKLSVAKRRGTVEKPEQRAWSSLRHYATGEVGAAEIESQRTAARQPVDGSSALQAKGELRFVVSQAPNGEAPHIHWFGLLFQANSPVSILEPWRLPETQFHIEMWYRGAI